MIATMRWSWSLLSFLWMSATSSKIATTLGRSCASIAANEIELSSPSILTFGALGRGDRLFALGLDFLVLFFLFADFRRHQHHDLRRVDRRAGIRRVEIDDIAQQHLSFVERVAPQH